MSHAALPVDDAPLRYIEEMYKAAGEREVPSAAAISSTTASHSRVLDWNISKRTLEKIREAERRLTRKPAR